MGYLKGKLENQNYFCSLNFAFYLKCREWACDLPARFFWASVVEEVGPERLERPALVHDRDKLQRARAFSSERALVDFLSSPIRVEVARFLLGPTFLIEGVYLFPIFIFIE